MRLFRLPSRPFRRNARAPRASGFTLNEVLIAMGVLAVGITAVASLFPSALILQRETVRDVLGQQNIRSSEALLSAKSLDGAALFRFTDNITGPTFTRNSADDVSASNSMPALLARGAQLVGPPRDRFVVSDVSLDLFALSEVDTYAPAFKGAGFPIDASIAADRQYLNLEYPDMRLATNYGDGSKTPTYSAHQSMLATWGEIDRSYPSYIPKFQDREIYTVPLVRRGIQASDFINDWVVYSIILERKPTDIEAFEPAGPDNDYPYRSFNAAAFAHVGTGEARNAIVCANPFDDWNVFPKVYRVPAINGTSAGDPDPTLVQLLISNESPTLGLLVRPGDLMLGDNGKIYRVAGLPDANNLSLLKVAEETRQDVSTNLDSGKALRAVWFAPRPTAQADSPLRDVRVLSQNVVRINN